MRAQIYEPLTRLTVHTVKAQHIATFLGKKLNTNFQGEAGNRYDVRIQGTRIKHTMAWGRSPSRCTTDLVSACGSGPRSTT